MLMTITIPSIVLAKHDRRKSLHITHDVRAKHDRRKVIGEKPRFFMVMLRLYSDTAI